MQYSVSNMAFAIILQIKMHINDKKASFLYFVPRWDVQRSQKSNSNKYSI